MDPGRRAMIEGWKSGSDSGRDRDRDRDITAPRRDTATRISKPTRQSPAPAGSRPAAANSSYISQEEQSRQFVADEDKFVLKQSKKKADIRVREGRAKPIDFLAFNLRFIDNDRDVFDDDDQDINIKVPSPETVMEGLGEAQLKDLEAELKSYSTLESNTQNREYWKALLALCVQRRQKIRPHGHEGRTVATVESDVDKILSPKTYEQLEALEMQIKAKLRSNEPIDTDYWEELLKSLLVWKARAKLKVILHSIQERRSELLKAAYPDRPNATVGSSSSNTPTGVTKGNGALGVKKAAAAPGAFAIAESSAPPPGTARFALGANEDFTQATKALYEREVARGVDEDEEIFTGEEAVSNGTKPQWADKHRPRKPRYFNRVQMGYEWNKYNQTHYDHDNPPPKVVQGYKFNIFYPDLIDKTKAPTFKIVREGGRRRGEMNAPAGEDETCLIRFIAGPPYEDIAFRIVDKEWDYSAKRDRGYRSSFDKGILQLHFQFKKVYYRK